MSKVYVFFADGFEEIEGLTVVDILRRAGVETQMVSIKEETVVIGAHGIAVQTDVCLKDTDCSDADLLVLPGGMPGTLNLGQHRGLEALLRKFYQREKFIAAICAATVSLVGFCKRV